MYLLIILCMYILVKINKKYLYCIYTRPPTPLFLRVYKGTVITEPITFKPMLVKGHVSCPYVPYNLGKEKLREDINTINSNLLWKELANDKLEVDISNLEYKELLIMFHIVENNAFTNALTIHILGKITETEPRYYNTGYYMNENENCGIRVAVSNSAIVHNKTYLNGGATVPSMFVYYR